MKAPLIIRRPEPAVRDSIKREHCPDCDGTGRDPTRMGGICPYCEGGWVKVGRDSSWHWSFWGTLALGAFTALLILFCTSCTVTFHPDGSREYKLNPEGIPRAWRVIKEK